MGIEDRHDLIRQIEDLRDSRVLTYICSDRDNASAQIGMDAVRPMYDHVRSIGRVEQLDLFLYSQGGQAEVPWRIVSMLREYADRLGVLIPYHAQSAATLIAIGCDEIVMGPKAELGPIDPALNRRIQGGDGGTPVQEQIRVEDVMAFIDFIRDKGGLGDQSALAANIQALSEQLTPQLLGSIYRTHSHIRDVARKLLTGREERTDEQRVDLIVESLAEDIYSHGHAIARSEARELGLPIVDAEEQSNGELETSMWKLLEEYEAQMDMRDPIDINVELGDEDEASIPIQIAAIESRETRHVFDGALEVERPRQTADQYNINLNLGINLPQNLQQQAQNNQQLQQQLQQLVQHLQQEVQNEVPNLVKEQVRDQSPILGTHGRLEGGSWREVTDDEWSGGDGDEEGEEGETEGNEQDAAGDDDA